MVDVVFVLLLFFMACAGQNVKEGFFSIGLPSQSASKDEKIVVPILIDIDPNGTCSSMRFPCRAARKTGNSHNSGNTSRNPWRNRRTIRSSSARRPRRATSGSWTSSSPAAPHALRNGASASRFPTEFPGIQPGGDHNALTTIHVATIWPDSGSRATS